MQIGADVIAALGVSLGEVAYALEATRDGSVDRWALGGGEAADAFASRARRTTRRSSSLFGPREDVLRLWAGVEPAWGPAREVRRTQPLMVCDTPLVEPDPRALALLDADGRLAGAP